MFGTKHRQYEGLLHQFPSVKNLKKNKKLISRFFSWDRIAKYCNKYYITVKHVMQYIAEDKQPLSDNYNLVYEMVCEAIETREFFRFDATMLRIILSTDIYRYTTYVCRKCGTYVELEDLFYHIYLH